MLESSLVAGQVTALLVERAAVVISVGKLAIC